MESILHCLLDVVLFLPRRIIHLAQSYIGRPILQLILVALFGNRREAGEYLDVQGGLKYSR
jgi:hypothetical protein